MTKYNANGGQRRSSTVKIGIPATQFVTCELCGRQQSLFAGNVKEKLCEWEIQSFSPGLKFLTCQICKKLNPIVMLEKYEARKP